MFCLLSSKQSIFILFCVCPLLQGKRRRSPQVDEVAARRALRLQAGAGRDEGAPQARGDGLQSRRHLQGEQVRRPDRAAVLLPDGQAGDGLLQHPRAHGPNFRRLRHRPRQCFRPVLGHGRQRARGHVRPGEVVTNIPKFFNHQLLDIHDLHLEDP